MIDKKLDLNNLINDTVDNTPNDLISVIAVNELVNSKNIKRISRINPEQVNILTKLYLFSDVFNTSFTSLLANNILDLQISIKGLGRREMVQLVQQRTEPMDERKFFNSNRDIFR